MLITKSPNRSIWALDLGDKITSCMQGNRQQLDPPVSVKGIALAHSLLCDQSQVQAPVPALPEVAAWWQHGGNRTAGAGALSSLH